VAEHFLDTVHRHPSFERVNQVVGIRLQIKSGIDLAKPGMPADGRFSVEAMPGT
jgi:hypothetical protein